MIKTKIIKHPWFKPVLVALLFIGLIILLSQAIILSHPKPLQLYLEFLGRSSQRGQEISVYSKEEFAKKYLGVDNNGVYQPDAFLKLLSENLAVPPVKENNYFIVYEVFDKNHPCQSDVFGVSRKKDLVYVSFQKTCLKNDHKNK